MNEKAKLNLVSAAAAETASIQLQKDLIKALLQIAESDDRDRPAKIRGIARTALQKAGVRY